MLQTQNATECQGDCLMAPPRKLSLGGLRVARPCVTSWLRCGTQVQQPGFGPWDVSDVIYYRCERLWHPRLRPSTFVRKPGEILPQLGWQIVLVSSFIYACSHEHHPTPHCPFTDPLRRPVVTARVCCIQADRSKVECPLFGESQPGISMLQNVYPSSLHC